LVITINLISLSLDHCYLKLLSLSTHYSSRLVKLIQFCLWLIVFAEFGCNICRKVLASPLTTPCAHNFCKGCLEGAFSGQSYIRNRTTQSGRSLRTQKNVMKCPTCATDIAEYLQNPQVLLHIFLNRSQ